MRGKREKERAILKKRISLWNSSKTIPENRDIFKKNNVDFKGYSSIFVFRRIHNLKYLKLDIYGEKTVKVLKVAKPNMSVKDIVKITGFKYHTVAQILCKHKVPHVTQKQAILNRNFNKKIVCYLRKNEFKFSEIARLFNCSRQRVHQMLDE